MAAKGVRPTIGKTKAIAPPMVWQVVAKRTGISELGFERMMIHYFGAGWMMISPPDMIPKLEEMGIWKESTSLVEGIQVLWWTFNKEEHGGAEEE